MVQTPAANVYIVNVLGMKRACVRRPKTSILAARLRVLRTPPHAKAWKEMERESEKRREREGKGVKGRRERGRKRKMEW